MTREDMIRMAKEAGWQYAHDDSGYEPLWEFAALVASAERERIKQANAPEIERINAHIKEALAQPKEFKPDYNTEAVLVEEQQRMAKRIEDLEALLERQTARIVDLQTHIDNFDGENR